MFKRKLDDYTEFIAVDFSQWEEDKKKDFFQSLTTSNKQLTTVDYQLKTYNS